MNFSARNFSYSSIAILSIILGLILALLLFLGLFVEKYKNAELAEQNRKSVTLSISQEEVVTQEENHSQAPTVSGIQIEDKPVVTAMPTVVKEDPALREKKYLEDKRPAIALVIGGIGLSKSETKSALDLKAEITLGLSPYASDIDKLSNDAASLGHDVLINIPLEPANYPDDDPGPLGLISSLPEDENLKRLQFILSITNNSGIYSVDDEKFSRSVIVTRSLFGILQKQNKLFLYGLSNGNNYIKQLADKEGYPLLVNDEIIDIDLAENNINNKLSILEEKAKENGYAIGYGTTYPVTIKAVENWANTLENKGIRLVPIRIISAEKR